MSTPARFALLVGITIGVAAGGAPPATAAAGEPQDQIVLSGRVVVQRGEVVGEVVVLHGSAIVAGVARGDVVVLDGRISILGQVSGSVVDVTGPVFLGPNAQVLGDVLARGSVVVKPGASVSGTIREGTAFTFRTPISAFGRFAGWLAVSVSTLLLGLVLILFVPRGADAVFVAVRTAPWSSTGWGLAAFVGLPLLAILAIASLIGLPLGLILLLALALLYFVGYTWSAWVVGRALLRPPRNMALAFLTGWTILRALALIPFAGIVTWVAGAVLGLGLMTVATWRARGRAGRHRGGRIRPAAPEAAPVADEPRPSEARPPSEAPPAPTSRGSEEFGL